MTSRVSTRTSRSAVSPTSGAGASGAAGFAGGVGAGRRPRRRRRRSVRRRRRPRSLAARLPAAGFGTGFTNSACQTYSTRNAEKDGEKNASFHSTVRYADASGELDGSWPAAHSG